MILISTGEASGDAVGAALVREIRKLGYEGEIAAIGGHSLAGTGSQMIEDTRGWAAIGIVQSLRVAPRVWLALQRVKRWLSKTRPSLVIAVDFGAFNVPLCRAAKKVGSRVLYFMPPGSWRRDRQGGSIQEVSDLIATPFEWSAKLLGARWVGHPLLQMTGTIPDDSRDCVALLPGSRVAEVRHTLPVMAEACEEIDFGFRSLAVGCSPSMDPDELQNIWRRSSSKPMEVVEGARELLKKSYAALVCSGTATLEAAITRTPMVILYKVSKLSELEAKLVRFRVDHIGLPNILLGKRVIPELVQNEATPKRIAKELLPLLGDSPQRNAQLGAFQQVVAQLGESDGLTQTARVALELLTQSTRTDDRPS